MENADLPALAGQARRYLQWTCFLLLVTIVILAIDVRLKNAVARQAQVASRLYTDMVMRYGGQAPDPSGGAGADRDGGGGVGGTAGLAAQADPGPGPAESAEDAVVDGKAQRAPGDGRRAGGPR